jgi:hypothetical protein
LALHLPLVVRAASGGLFLALHALGASFRLIWLLTLLWQMRQKRLCKPDALL